MKTKAASKVTPYLGECIACGEEIETKYKEFSQIPADIVELLCGDCAHSSNTASQTPRKQVYYKNCGHKNAPVNTMPILADLVIVNAEKHEKKRYKARCGNCSG